MKSSPLSYPIRHHSSPPHPKSTAAVHPTTHKTLTPSGPPCLCLCCFFCLRSHSPLCLVNYYSYFFRYISNAISCEDFFNITSSYQWLPGLFSHSNLDISRLLKKHKTNTLRLLIHLPQSLPHRPEILKVIEMNSFFIPLVLSPAPST